MPKPDGSNRCFVVRPFEPSLRNMWELAIKPAVEEAGLEAWDGQEERLGSNIIHRDISYLVWNSRLIIAELTNRNPNVMYELGMAHAAKKPVIMLIEDGEDPPFDVNHIRYLRYDKYNLHELRRSLTARIASTLAAPNDQHADLFPELEIVTDALRQEITYLRARAARLEVEVIPRCADFFLNDRLTGSGSGEILINPDYARNTISASTVGFFEHHREITPADISAGRLQISLEKVHQPGVDAGERLSGRVPRWLRDRRRDPHNPVLMRAISSYLMATGENDDALEEITDLLEVAPSWFMAINQAGFFYGTTDRLERALSYYHRVVAIKPGHFIGHLNLACVYSLMGELDESIERLRAIAENAEATASIRETLDRLSHDQDFRNVIADDRRSAEFREIELTLFPGTKDDDWRTLPRESYYRTF
jgi:tetratricopeptide (TPR) repeat protein